MSLKSLKVFHESGCSWNEEKIRDVALFCDAFTCIQYVNNGIV
jgi:hypothetical protein